MNQLEIIRIRLFKQSNTDQVRSLFQQFEDKLNETDEQNMFITLFKNKNVENEWSIHLASLKDSATKEGYNLTVLLSEAFRTIGMVSRDVWKPVLLKGMERTPQKYTVH